MAIANARQLVGIYANIILSAQDILVLDKWLLSDGSDIVLLYVRF